MVTFPEKPGEESREGHHVAQNPRGSLKRSHRGGTGDLTGKPSLPRPTAIAPVTSLPGGASGAPQSSPRAGGPFPSPDPPLPKAGLAGACRSYLGSLRRQCKHPEDLRVLGRDLRCLLLAPRIFSLYLSRESS